MYKLALWNETMRYAERRPLIGARSTPVAMQALSITTPDINHIAGSPCPHEIILLVYCTTSRLARIYNVDYYINYRLTCLSILD